MSEVKKGPAAERVASDRSKCEIDAALDMLKSNSIELVDLQFPDLFGRLQHTTIPVYQFDRNSFTNGFAKLDGSSITGFTEIFESDMMLLPIPSTLAPIPWMPDTARILCRIFKGSGAGRFERDPRWIAERAEEHQAGLGLRSYFGPEPEFFIFDSVERDVSVPSSGIGYKIHAREAPWEAGGGYKIRNKGGYYPAEPVDQLGQIRGEIVKTLRKDFGFSIEAVHHEVATGGQSEINFRYGELVETAQRVETLKYVVKNVVNKHGMVATFMPKPMYGDNGTGMHTHFSLWNSDGTKNLMYDKDADYAELSQMGRYAVGGLLRHARALSAIVSPTVNSYHRLIPGFEAPVYTAWSSANRSAVIRIPAYVKGIEAAKRLEYRAPDPTCNPYLAFPAVLMAGLDGVKKATDPGPPVVSENIYHMSAEKRKALGIGELPRSLNEALDDLESDSDFLKPVFGKELLETYIDLKRKEAREIAQYPHPIEHHYYLDA